MEHAITDVYDMLGGQGPRRSVLMVLLWEDFWEREIPLI